MISTRVELSRLRVKGEQMDCIRYALKPATSEGFVLAGAEKGCAANGSVTDIYEYVLICYEIKKESRVLVHPQPS